MKVYKAPPRGKIKNVSNGERGDGMNLFRNEISAEHEKEMKRAPQHIEGIKCDVKSCAFHDGDSYCCANGVAIGPSYAKLTTETVCATYRRRRL